MVGSGCVTYLHAPVTAQGDDVVAEDGVLVCVELSSGHLGGCRHTGGVRDTLKQQQTKKGRKQKNGRKTCHATGISCNGTHVSKDSGYHDDTEKPLLGVV